jgi:hypothetical protein
MRASTSCAGRLCDCIHVFSDIIGSRFALFVTPLPTSPSQLPQLLYLYLISGQPKRESGAVIDGGRWLEDARATNPPS